MKLSLPALFTLCLIFSSCNHFVKEEQQSTTSGTDSSYTSADTHLPDSIMLKEPIVNSIKHYFSDTSNMDSFVIEMPAGNILANLFSIKIYDRKRNLLFADSASPTEFWREEYFNQMTVDPELPVKSLRRSIMAMFNADNFNCSGQEDAIKNASSNEIKNKAGWNEALNDTTKIVFNYIKPNLGIEYVSYSQRLKKAAVVVQTMPEEDRD